MRPLDNQVNIQELEKCIKKYLAGKFEDERITKVKKTTNWNITVGEDLKTVLNSGYDDRDGITEDVIEELREKNNIIYKKYSLDQEKKKILVDFEDYMLYSRKGGTNSKLRPEGHDKDEDIRTHLVQEYIDIIAKDVRKKCWAIPINAPLSGLDDLWEALRTTRMHEIDNQDVEFSLSVMLRPYPCNIYSVWIYIAVFRDDLDDNDD